MPKTFYIPSVSLNDNEPEIYVYRRDKENLGTLSYRIDTNDWKVFDYMNNEIRIFSTKKQAKEFIKTRTPILR